jgi:voltage-dependent anion channel protein 2
LFCEGLTLSETWTSANTIGAEVELADSLTKGLKLGLNGNFSPATASKNAKASVEYKQEHLFTNLGVDVFKGPFVTADASIGVEDVVVGGEVGYNVKDGKVAKYGAVLGYTASDFAVAVHALSNFNTFSASYFHRVNGDLDVGGRAVWDRKSANATVALEAGAKYSLDQDAFVKAKVNNAGVLGLGFTQALRQGIKVSLGGSFDTARLNENAHKLGLSLTFEA